MPNAPTTLTIDRGDIMGALMEFPPQQSYIATEIFPPFEVPKTRGSFGVIPAEAMLQSMDNKKSKGGRYNRGDWDLEELSYSLKRYGTEEAKDEEEMDNYMTVFDYEVAVAQRNEQINLVAREQRAAAVCHNLTTLPLSGSTGHTASVPWGTHGTSAPALDVQTAREGIRARCGLTPDAMQIPWSAWYDLWESSKILEKIKYTVTAQVPDPTDLAARTAMAKALGLKKIIVGDQVYNSAKKGQAPVFADVWSASYAFVFVSAKSRNVQEPCWGRTFYKTSLGGLGAVQEYREEAVEADIYRWKSCEQQKGIMAACGYLIAIT